MFAFDACEDETARVPPFSADAAEAAPSGRPASVARALAYLDSSAV